MDDITDTTDDPWAEWAPTPEDVRSTWERRARTSYLLPSERAELAARSDIPADLRAELLADAETRDAGRRMIANGRAAIFDDPSVFFDTDTDSPPAA